LTWFRKTSLIWFADHSRKPTREEEKNGSSTQTAGDEKGRKPEKRIRFSVLGSRMRIPSPLFIDGISGSQPAGLAHDPVRDPPALTHDPVTVTYDAETCGKRGAEARVRKTWS